MSFDQILVQALGLTLLYATPYLYAALGELFVQRSGVLNLGVEGMMLMGAFTAIYVVSALGGDPWLGWFAAMLVGGVMGLAMAFVSVTLRAEQGISGIGFTLFGQGMSSLLFKSLVGGVITAQGKGFQVAPIPLLSEIPVLGTIFFQQKVPVYLAFLLVPVAMWFLYRTRWGLQIRAVGQNPAAADSMGVNVARVRYLTLIFGGAMAGAAGAALSIVAQSVFQENMTAGRGFIAVALVYFGSWSPWRVMVGALLFSLANNLQIWAQNFDVRIAGQAIPPNLLIMTPYVLTIFVLVFFRQRRSEPAALTKPFVRGEN